MPMAKLYEQIWCSPVGWYYRPIVISCVTVCNHQEAPYLCNMSYKHRGIIRTIAVYGHYGSEHRSTIWPCVWALVLKLRSVTLSIIQKKIGNVFYDSQHCIFPSRKLCTFLSALCYRIVLPNSSYYNKMFIKRLVHI